MVDWSAATTPGPEPRAKDRDLGGLCSRGRIQMSPSICQPVRGRGWIATRIDAELAAGPALMSWFDFLLATLQALPKPLTVVPIHSLCGIGRGAG